MLQRACILVTFVEGRQFNMQVTASHRRVHEGKVQSRKTYVGDTRSVWPSTVTSGEVKEHINQRIRDNQRISTDDIPMSISSRNYFGPNRKHFILM